MKNVIIGILLAVSVALGGLLLQANNKVAKAEARLTASQQALVDLEASVSQREEQAAKLRERLEQSVAESAANAGTAAQLSVALTNRVEAEEKTNKATNPLAEMFKDPKMRDIIKQQQKTVMSGMVEKNYAGFFKSMNMTEEQQKAMKDLLLEKMLGNADLGMEMMSGELTPERRAEMRQKMKEAADASNQQLKDLLGADNYSQFETYEKSVPDRMALEQFKGQLSADLALNSNQEQSLLTAISEERQNFKFTTDFSNQQDFSEDMFSKFTEDRMDVYFQEQDQLIQRYLARAQNLLSPDQYNTYAKSLKTQQDMMKMGMKMAVSMFGTKKK